MLHYGGSSGIMTVNKSRRFHRNDLLKMLAVVIIPVIAVIVLTGLLLETAIEQRNRALETVSTFGVFAIINVVVTEIRMERGMSSTAAILAMNDTSANSELVLARHETDRVLQELAFWPYNLIIDGNPVTTKASLIDSLVSYRQQVDAMAVDYNDILDHYSHITTSFMDWMQVKSTLVLFLHYYKLKIDSETGQT
jgi:hypothetical protein